MELRTRRSNRTPETATTRRSTSRTPRSRSRSRVGQPSELASHDVASLTATIIAKEGSVSATVTSEDHHHNLLDDAISRIKTLLPFHSVPIYLQEKYVLHSYRKPGLTAKECVHSLFSWHNETVNVWTHLLGFLLFLFLLVYTALYFSPTTGFSRLQPLHTYNISLLEAADHHPFFAPLLHKLDSAATSLSDLRVAILQWEDDVEHKLRSWEREVEHLVDQVIHRIPLADTVRAAASRFAMAAYDQVVDVAHEASEAAESAMSELREFLKPQSVPRWPVFIYILCAMNCLFSSTLYHLFGTHSHKTYTLLARCDYSGIATLIAGSCVPAFYYGFYCSAMLKWVYLSVMCAIGAVIVVMANLDWFYQPNLRVIRALMFVSMGVFGVVPGAHMLVHVGTKIVLPFSMYMAAMGVCYLAGATLYATRIPERYAPGKFDLIGHSHQLFHVLVVVAALIHFAGCVHLHHVITTCHCAFMGA